MSDRHLIFPDRALADVLKDMQRRITTLEKRSQWLNRFGDASKIWALSTVVDPTISVSDSGTTFVRLETVMPSGAFLAVVRVQMELYDPDAFDTGCEALFRVINLDSGTPHPFAGPVSGGQNQPEFGVAEFVFPVVANNERLAVEVEATLVDEGREDPPGTPDPLANADVSFTIQLTIWQN